MYMSYEVVRMLSVGPVGPTLAAVESLSFFLLLDNANGNPFRQWTMFHFCFIPICTHFGSLPSSLPPLLLSLLSLLLMPLFLMSLLLMSLQGRIESGNLDFSDAQPSDVTSVVKEFFRNLPEPLLPFHFHDAFFKVRTSVVNGVCVSCIVTIIKNWQFWVCVIFLM